MPRCSQRSDACKHTWCVVVSKSSFRPSQGDRQRSLLSIFHVRPTYRLFIKKEKLTVMHKEKKEEKEKVLFYSFVGTRKM